MIRSGNRPATEELSPWVCRFVFRMAFLCPCRDFCFSLVSGDTRYHWALGFPVFSCSCLHPWAFLLCALQREWPTGIQHSSLLLRSWPAVVWMISSNLDPGVLKDSWVFISWAHHFPKLLKVFLSALNPFMFMSSTRSNFQAYNTIFSLKSKITLVLVYFLFLLMALVV